MRINKEINKSKMKAKFIYEFERGSNDPKKGLDMGMGNIRKKFDQHIESIEDYKKNRSEEQIAEDEAQKLYAFIYTPSFIPVEIDGETYHKKSIEIENLYQIDKYNKGDLMAYQMMKIRATAQGGDSKFATVWIPTFLHDSKTAYDREISDSLRKYIIQNKKRA